MEERRRHQRFYMEIPIRYRVKIPGGTPGVCYMTSGVLKNISHGGLFFISIGDPRLQQDQIRDFTFMPDERDLEFSKIANIAARSRVVRIESQHIGSHVIGIALEFLSKPVLGD